MISKISLLLPFDFRLQSDKLVTDDSTKYINGTSQWVPEAFPLSLNHYSSRSGKKAA